MGDRVALVAPDKFKGTFTAAEVSAALADGARRAGWSAIELPIADGGEGTADALLRSRGGRWVEQLATDALGRPVRARWAMLADERTAVVEAASASGLWRLAPRERHAIAASSLGTGQLVVAAANAGATRVIVAAGGTASTDGGAGAAQAIRGLGELPRLVVACDTRAMFEDAARLYGPQKGAGPLDVQRLERRLDRTARLTPRDPRGTPFGGSGGGLAGGLWAEFDAVLVHGASLILDELELDGHLARASAVLTGEGRLDATTLTGKAVAELARRSRLAAVPCWAVVGQAALPALDATRLGLRGVAEAPTLVAIAAAARQLLEAEVGRRGRFG